jgi:hypothetical protein
MPAKPLQIADDTPIGDFHYDRYQITAICPCGHERELRGEFVRRVIGLQTTIGTLRRRLRCHKCQKGRPKITVARMAR